MPSTPWASYTSLERMWARTENRHTAGSGNPHPRETSMPSSSWITSMTTTVLNLAVTAAVVVTVQFLAEPLIRLFDSTSPEMIRVGVLYLRLCCGVNSLVYAAMYTLDSFAIGVGAAHVAMVNALLDAVVVRLPVVWLLALPLSMGFPGIYLGQALSPILPALVGFIYFKSRVWERKTLVREHLGEVS